MFFFGKSSFAKCYQISDVVTKDFGGKVVSKKFDDEICTKPISGQLVGGQPSFETKTLEGGLTKMKICEYRGSSYLRKSAAEMITSMLQSETEKLPTIGELLHFEFPCCLPVPMVLPSSSRTMAARMQLNEKSAHRKPLTELNGIQDDKRLESTFLKKNLHDGITVSVQVYRHDEDYRSDIESLYQQLTNLFKAKPRFLQCNLGDENTDPAAQPMVWISKWVDHSVTYGFAYQLCDDGIGVIFNDTTKLILLPNHTNVHYIDKDGIESSMTTSEYAKELDKKMKLLSYFKRYMAEHLVKTGANNVFFETEQKSPMPHLHTWFRTTCAVVMHLTNGTVQLNFFDHMKIILSPRLSAMTYVDQEKNFHTYRFSTIIQHGCSKDLYLKLRYAHQKLGKMLEKKFF